MPGTSLSAIHVSAILMLTATLEGALFISI